MTERDAVLWILGVATTLSAAGLLLAFLCGGWGLMGYVPTMGSMPMMGGYALNAGGQRITIDQATQVAEAYLASYGSPDIAIDEIMEFQYNYYVIYYEKSTGIRAFEMLIDPYSGGIFPEYGPNMMWNTKYGMMGGIGASATASMPVTEDQAIGIAESYLRTNIPGASLEKPDVFYGYYTIHIIKDGRIYGMLSVNGHSGQVWYHSWHGQFVQVKEF